MKLNVEALLALSGLPAETLTEGNQAATLPTAILRINDWLDSEIAYFHKHAKDENSYLIDSYTDHKRFCKFKIQDLERQAATLQAFEQTMQKMMR
jgi:hypothetical protein